MHLNGAYKEALLKVIQTVTQLREQIASIMSARLIYTSFVFLSLYKWNSNPLVKLLMGHNLINIGEKM